MGQVLFSLIISSSPSLNIKLNDHKSSGDHDGRYYTEAEVNKLLYAKQNASTAITTSNIGDQSVARAKLADQARATYNGNGSPICVTLNANNQVQFQWNSSNFRVYVYVDNTMLGYINILQ